MSDVKFRATVKHVGAEVGDLPWLEEFWAVRYGDYSALQDHIEKLEANLAKAVEALSAVEGWTNNPEIEEFASTTIAELTSSEAAYGEAKGDKDE